MIRICVLPHACLIYIYLSPVCVRLSRSICRWDKLWVQWGRWLHITQSGATLPTSDEAMTRWAVGGRLKSGFREVEEQLEAVGRRFGAIKTVGGGLQGGWAGRKILSALAESQSQECHPLC